MDPAVALLQDTLPPLGPADLQQLPNIVAQLGQVITINADKFNKCTFMLTLLTEKALDLAMAVWDRDTHMRNSYTHISQLLCDVFKYPLGGHTKF